MAQRSSVVSPIDSKEPIRTQPGIPVPPGHNLVAQLWMPKPEGFMNEPPGLEYLGLVDKLLIKQIKELAEIVLDWETTNKYKILNGSGQQVYYAFEESGCCTRQFCGPQRGFTIHIVDNFNKEVVRIIRPFKCCAVLSNCWCAVAGSCCGDELTVEAPPGNVIGTVQQRLAGCSNSYVVLNYDGQPILDLEGPCCCVMCGCQDKVYPMRTISGEEVGEIKKMWGGIIKEAFTSADTFGVTFPMDMAIRTKAIMIGATFLIDYMNFETKSNHSS